MDINKDKSGIMFLELGNYNKINKKYKNLDIEKLPIINKYKYLGITIDNNLNLNYNTKNIIGKININKKLIAVQKMFNNQPDLIIQIIKTFIIP